MSGSKFILFVDRLFFFSRISQRPFLTLFHGYSRIVRMLRFPTDSMIGKLPLYTGITTPLLLGLFEVISCGERLSEQQKSFYLYLTTSKVDGEAKGKKIVPGYFEYVKQFSRTNVLSCFLHSLKALNALTATQKS